MTNRELEQAFWHRPAGLVSLAKQELGIDVQAKHILAIFDAWVTKRISEIVLNQERYTLTIGEVSDAQYWCILYREFFHESLHWDNHEWLTRKLLTEFYA